MATQKAIVLQGGTSAALVTDRPIPRLRPGYVLVDVKAVALNPTDWKHRERINTPGALSGCDYAGVVAETGTGYSKDWKKGDRICGFVHGGNELEKEDGAFAEKIVVKADVQMRIPDNMSFEDAATLGVAVVTVGQGLYQGMGLNYPNDPSTSGDYILIYGGSSAMGTAGVQFAKLSGYKVIATCSPRNFDLVKSMGAEAVFDYRDPNAVEEIKKYTNNNLKFIWDVISLEATAKFCAQVLSSGGTYGVLLGLKSPRDDIKFSYTLGYTAVGEPVKKMSYMSGDNTKDFEWTKKWIPIAESIIAQGKIKVHPTKVEHGLEGILNGMDLMKEDKVSGNKLVFTV